MNRAALFILGSLMTTGVAEGEPATQARIPEDRRIERETLERATADLVRVNVDSIEQIVRFCVEADVLMARAGMKAPVQEDFRVVAPQLRGVARLRIIELPGTDEPGRNFNLVIEDLSDPGTGHSITHVAAISGRLIIARDSETNTGTSSIQLIQDPPALADPSGVEPPVRLLVRVNDEQSGAADVDLKLAASSFSELMRKHPRELNRFFRPILRDFGQEQAVFGSDRRAQWQVLSQDFALDPMTTARVRDILTKFDSEDYQTRQEAQAQLQQLGQPAAIALTRMDRSTFSAEQQSGVDTFLAPYMPLSAADVTRLRDNVDFLIDCLYSDDASLRALSAARLNVVTGSPPPPAAVDGDPDAIETLRRHLTSSTQPSR